MDGKALEKLLQESCKIQDIDCTRLRDAGWQGEQTQRRFTVKNICDFIVFGDGTLVYVECKSSKDRLALSRLTQQKDLLSKAASTAQNIFCGYLVWIDFDFVFIRAGAVDQFASTGKKSINKADAMRIGTVIQLFTHKRARKPRLDIKELIYELNHPF
jgi:penicillin-binding protein-related factor A (putative recombinase)